MKFNTNSSHVFLLITIIASFGLSSARQHDCDILKQKKDDCGNICGQINTKTSENTCGDPDKRSNAILQVHDESDKDDGKTEYDDVKYAYECVEACPSDYHLYKSSQFCVKNIVEFEQFEERCKSGSDSESSNIWVIILSICGVVVAAVGGGFAYLKKKNSGKTRLDSPNVRASEVGLTKNDSV